MLEMRNRDGSHYELDVAGDALNTAAGISLLGGSAHLASGIGDDTNSARLFEKCKALGVGTEYISQIPSTSIGLYLISTDSDGERSFSYWRDQSAAHCLLFDAKKLQLALQRLESERYLYLSGITLSRTSHESREILYNWLDQFRDLGGCIIYDGNYRARLWENRELALQEHTKMLERTTVFLSGMEDERELRGLNSNRDVIAQIEQQDIPEVVVKDGEQNVQIHFQGRKSEVKPETVLRVTDTSGAGDSFNAGYLACRLKGIEPEEAAQFACKVSAMVIQQPGAIPAENHWSSHADAIAGMLSKS
ncbi:MAG: sugar kinase [Halioglobus sp.]